MGNTNFLPIPATLPLGDPDQAAVLERKREEALAWLRARGILQPRPVYARAPG
jgi:hypothetical protein